LLLGRGGGSGGGRTHGLSDGSLGEVVYLEVMALVVGRRVLEIKGREHVEHIEVWSRPTHQLGPYHSHSLSLLMSHSQNPFSSRPVTAMSSASTYVCITWQGVVLGLPSYSFQRSSHSFSIALQSVADRSFFI
jgi:hypothetical protein